MKSAIDTNVIAALWSKEPAATVAGNVLEKVREDGALAICGVVYSELLAYPGMPPTRLNEFLRETGIDMDFEFDGQLWYETGIRCARYAERRRRAKGGSQRGLLADFMIGAHALLRADRLVSFNEADFRTDFPELTIFPPRRTH